MGSEDKVKRTDYLGYPVGLSSSDSHPEQLGSMSRNYLGAETGHLREQSVDTGAEGYDSQQLARQDSRSPLKPPNATLSDGYPVPQGAQPPYVAVPPQAANQAPPAGRVHYPPSPFLAQRQEYTTIPLNDDSAASYAVARDSPQSAPQSGTTTPNGSGRGKKHFSFLPTHSNPSYPSSPAENGQGSISEKKQKRPKTTRGASWDLLGERPDWEGYNPAQASVENLRYAQGDVGTTKLSRLYYWALNRGIIVRWALYIIPILALLWIPGIVGVTAAPNGKVWSVKLIWWSIWLTILWGGFWASTALFMIVPTVWQNSVGSIIPAAKQYTDVLRALGKYAKLVTWTVAMWISFTPLVINHYDGDQTATSRSDLTTFASILFGLFLSSIVFGVEKLIVQLIALKFHRDSYEDRLAEQKFQVKCVTTLYINSHDIPGRSDTLIDNASSKTSAKQASKMAIRKALRGLKEVAQTTTTAFGNVASEMAGQSVLQTNSPANKVTAALTSANKSKALARRLYYSFRQPGIDHLTIADVARYFPDLDTAQAAFAILDKDGNGDATRDEIESAILALHRERLSLEASMRDLDGAVRRLDDIFMVVVGAIVILILASMITTKLTTLVTSAGTFILGLSWLIGSTMQEILLACIFLFVKHPYDVGDRVDIDGVGYTVAKMQLMSTNFKRVDGKFVWIGHNTLAAKVIENIRRSGPTHETFSFEVDFGTSFEALQALRAKMLKFCKDESRDFLPIFDVIVDDIPGQSKMVLKADIKYKSNWQQGALKIQRRNKWICALKMTLADLKIWGPGGAGDPAPAPPDPTRYTMVPWEEVNAAPEPAKPESPPPTFATATATNLTDRHEVINDSSQDIWDEQDELAEGLRTRAGTPGVESALNTPSTGGYFPVQQMRQRAAMQHGVTPDQIEMVSAAVNRR
ncbi:Mechanosensitive ion channel-domain-containing protein [Naematelia encephala]|uniref:Mechanosensitive ion channel protein n=1 Tax=Naematelia encephala TaxID=71784 RepID=A0A1Y2BGV5_9TREE|nr:Mechanosensitive ion channel-domain-containing protein [Naematelia encephala]